MNPGKKNNYNMTSNSTSATSAKTEKKNSKSSHLPCLILAPSLLISSLSKTSCAATKLSAGTTEPNPGSTEPSPGSTEPSPGSTKSNPGSTNSSEFSEIIYQEENTCIMGKYNKKTRSRGSYRKGSYIKEYSQENVECRYRRTVKIDSPPTDNIPSDSPKEQSTKPSNSRPEKHVQFADMIFQRTFAVESSKSHNKVALRDEEKKVGPMGNLERVTLPGYNIPNDFDIEMTERNISCTRRTRKQRSHRSKHRNDLESTDKPQSSSKPSKTTNPVSSSDPVTSSEDHPDAEEPNNSSKFPHKLECYEEFLRRHWKEKIVYGHNLNNDDTGEATTDEEEPTKIPTVNKSVQKNDSNVVVSDSEVVYDSNIEKEASKNKLAEIPVLKNTKQVDEKITTKPEKIDFDTYPRPRYMPKRKIKRRSKSTYSRRDYELHYRKYFPYTHRFLFGPATDETIMHTVQTVFDYCIPKFNADGTRKVDRERAENEATDLNSKFNKNKRKRSRSNSKKKARTSSTYDSSTTCPLFGKFSEIKLELEDGKTGVGGFKQIDVDERQEQMANKRSSINSNSLMRNKGAQCNSFDFMESSDKKLTQNSDKKTSNGSEHNQITPYKINVERTLSNLSNPSSEGNLDDEEKLNAINYWDPEHICKFNPIQPEQALQVKAANQINNVPSNTDFYENQNSKPAIPANWIKQEISDQPKSYEMQPFIKQENSIDDEKQLVEDEMEVPTTGTELARYIEEPKMNTEPQTSLRKFSGRSFLKKSSEKSSVGLLPIDEKPDEHGADIRGISKRLLSERMQRETQQVDTQPQTSGYRNESFAREDSTLDSPTPVIEVHGEDRIMSELMADQSIDQTAKANGDVAEGAAGDTHATPDNPHNTRYVLTRIKEYEEFTAFEILRKSMPKPRTTRPKTERVFILKNKI